MAKKDEINELFDVDVEEVSLVGAPAIRKKFLLYKSQEVNDMAEVFDVQAALEELDKIEEVNQTAWDKLMSVVKAIVAPTARPETGGKGPETAKPEPVEKNLEKAIKDLLDKYGEELPPLVKGALNSYLTKQDEDEEEEEEEGYPEPEKGKAKGKAKKAEPDAVAVAKAEWEAGLQAERQRLEKRIAEAEKKAEHERDLRLKKEYVEKARGFIGLSADTDELAANLRKLDELDAGLGTYFTGLLKTADHEIVQGGLFSEIGTAAGPKAGNEFEALLAEHIKKAQAADPKLTYDQALVQVMKSGVGKDPRVRAAYESQ